MQKTNSLTLLWRNVAIFLSWTLLFSIAYAQSPLYTSNQNQYFLHGLAQAGYGYLNQDWLANTLDPTPVFTALVAFTYRFLHFPAWFYCMYALLMGIYFFSLIGIAAQIFPLRNSPNRWLTFLALVVLVHSAAWRFAISRGLGVNWTYILEDGVADQRLLGPVLQPSAFGVLLIFSIFLFMRRHAYFAVLVAALAATFHPTYLLSAASLTLGYMLVTALEAFRPASLSPASDPAYPVNRFTPRFQTELARNKPVRKPARLLNLAPSLGIGILALVAVLPILLYVYGNFGNTPAETTSQARAILIDYRIPHHALISWWLDATALLKIALVIAALFLIRKTRLFLVILVPFIIANGLTILQALTHSAFLALIFPWRLSTFIVPLATVMLLAQLVVWSFRQPWIPDKRFQRLTRIFSLLLLSAVVFIGGIRFFLDLQRKDANPERSMEAYVAGHKASGEVYLTPVKLQDFRLATGSPVYIEFKSIPYQDADVLEWYRRVKAVDRFYKGPDCNALSAFAQEGVTHLVLESAQFELSCPQMMETYRNTDFRIYRLQSH